ncbi:MAG TPA: hypothetical protein VKC66_22530, partial [Xanthobacteraceae bacterium]|nr:hypothetical protein [Xanthobacteraceae bacterium]
SRQRARWFKCATVVNAAHPFGPMSSARPHTGLPARPLWLGGILMSLASTLVSKRGGSVSAAMNQDRVGTTRDPRAPILISGHAAKSTKKRQPAMNRDPARREISL